MNVHLKNSKTEERTENTGLTLVTDVKIDVFHIHPLS